MRSPHMKIYFSTIILLIIASCSFAQDNRSYTAFIQQDTAIKWAAECNKIVNPIPKVSDYSIKQFYLARLKNGKANCYVLNSDRRSVSPTTAGSMNLNRQDWLAGLSAKFLSVEKTWVFIEKNDPVKGYRLNGTSNDPCCGCDEADALRVKQILYFKNHRFYIQNVFLSPLCARKDTADKASWYPVCNVAYNPEVDKNKPIVLSKDVLLINTEEVTYNFKLNENDASDSVLTIGGDHIIQRLFDEITAGKIKAWDFNKGKLIPAKQFSSWGTPRFLVPKFDQNGEQVSATEVAQERNPDSISQIRIQQEWYFDFKNEKLYSRIKWIDLVEKVYTSTGIFLGTTPFCRIRY